MPPLQKRAKVPKRRGCEAEVERIRVPRHGDLVAEGNRDRPVLDQRIEARAQDLREPDEGLGARQHRGTEKNVRVALGAVFLRDRSVLLAPQLEDALAADLVPVETQPVTTGDRGVLTAGNANRVEPRGPDESRERGVDLLTATHPQDLLEAGDRGGSCSDLRFDARSDAPEHGTTAEHCERKARGSDHHYSIP